MLQTLLPEMTVQSSRQSSSYLYLTGDCHCVNPHLSLHYLKYLIAKAKYEDHSLTACLLLIFDLTNAAQSRPNYIQYVNPLIGTERMGHTYPGATVPFGSVQLSPDTDEQPYHDRREIQSGDISILRGLSV